MREQLLNFILQFHSKMHTLGSMHLALEVGHTLGAEWSGLDGRSK